MRDNDSREVIKLVQKSVTVVGETTVFLKCLQMQISTAEIIVTVF